MLLGMPHFIVFPCAYILYMVVLKKARAAWACPNNKKESRNDGIPI